MPIRKRETEPESWREYRLHSRSTWTGLFFTLEWCLAWIAWALNNWAFVEVLERLGSFSILVAVIFYFAESGKRTRQEHYQAWQVINTAQDKGGSGGRIEALQQLNTDHVPLIGVDASNAFLQGVNLDGARLLRCNFAGADLRESNFRNAGLENANLHSANFRKADLAGADLKYSDMSEADFAGSKLANAQITGVDLSDADLRFADLNQVRCERIARAKLANIYGARNVSASLLAMLNAAGALSVESDEAWSKLEETSGR